MRGLRKYLTPFAPDQSGAVSVLYDLGGIVVVCDAGGCTGNICGFDEPRWHTTRSAVFSAGLRDMDAILGRDDKLVAELADAARKIDARFAAVVGTPVPSVIGTDYRALRRMAERACDLPVLTVDTTGMELYDAGAEKAYRELFGRFATEKHPVEQGRVCVLGANPLDMSCIPPQDMALTLDDVAHASAAEKCLVVAPSGLAAAQLLERRFGTPYEVRDPRGLVGLLAADDVERVPAGARVLVVAQQVTANTLRDELLARGAASVTCATWFMLKRELAQDGDVRLREEDDFEQLVREGGFDVIVGDPVLWPIVGWFGGVRIDLPQFPVSGALLPGRQPRRQGGQSRLDGYACEQGQSPSGSDACEPRCQGGQSRLARSARQTGTVPPGSGMGSEPAKGDCPQWRAFGRAFGDCPPWQAEPSAPGDSLPGQTAPTPTTARIRAYGIVQGVGFRPTVDRHAAAAGIRGTVCNKGPYVEIFAQGTPEQIERFVDLLRTQPPRRAAILKLDQRPAPDAPTYEGFSIIESEKTTGEIFVSPDIAICDDCARELFDPHDRRYLHPFVNCTCCGPRLTILDALPYDRERTSMAEFPMCAECAREYGDPASRRYDAQPVCCNDCGPEVYLLDRPERGSAAISEARRIVAAGGVVAVKGIGGFHLCCDATNPAAVDLLRERKRRSAKPFAVMARNLAVARRECETSAVAEDILTGHQKPILLLPKRAAVAGADAPRVCEAVAPDNPKLGVMLPYAPLQLLLFDYPDGVVMPDCLVMTSANESGAPICRDDDEARRELGPLADAILSHDRKIRVRADDTVMDLFEDRPYMVRRSRGWAPLPFVLSRRLGARVLAVGGELKNAFCLGTGDLLYPSPYVGDLEDVRTVRALEETIGRFQTLLEMEPEVVACDLHPRYNSCVVAQDIAREEGLPLVRVQHHYAHVVACMAENDVEGPVIGVSFDGTGYGDDGTIWGGEILLADAHGYERLGHIAPFAQAGGDAAAREGWRVAAGMLAGPDAPQVAERLGLCAVAEARLVQAMVARGVNTVASTSAGRLFDAVSAVLGIRRASTYEGEAATQLQFAAERGRARVCAGELSEPAGVPTETDELFAWVVERRLAGDDPELLAYAFHVGLADFVLAACAQAREKTGVDTVALTGGCYQNLLLLELSVGRLRAAGFGVLTHSLVPPNDGGVALGQAVAAAAAGCAPPKGTVPNG